jgi:AcrR family transcriptional regulator
MNTRSYSSAVRAQRKHETREQILLALVDAVLHEGIHAFSVPLVAERAGVALRTVYRHFPTREALLDGLSELLIGAPNRVAIDHDAICQSFRVFDEQANLVRAYVITSLALQLEPSDRPERTRRMQEEFVVRFPNLDPKSVAITFAALRVLVSTRGWHLLHQEGISGAQAGPEVARLFDLVVADLHAQNDAAAAAHVRSKRRRAKQ